MLDQAKILEFNPHLGLLNNCYQDTRNLFRESKVHHALQSSISDVFANTSDLSLFSLELERNLNTPELRKALDSAPFNFLESINFENVHRVLDLSAEFGGTINYLLNRVDDVDAVRADPDQARLAQIRNSKNDRLCLISEDLEQLTWPFNHYDLIIISSLEKLSLPTEFHSTFFARLKKSLSENGQLIVVCHNPQSLQYRLNGSADKKYIPAPVSHSAKEPTLIGDALQQLHNNLQIAGFRRLDQFASFSSDQTIRNLFSESYLRNTPFALNHFHHLGSLSQPKFNEYDAYRTEVEAGQKLIDLCSSILICVQNSQNSRTKLLDIDFAHYPGKSRKAQWRAVTFKKSESNSVYKKQRFPICAEQSNELIVQNIEPQQFVKGQTLITDWVDAVLSNDIKTLSHLVKEYSQWLSMLHSQLGEEKFYKTAYDMLPRNILFDADEIDTVSGNRKFQTIDTEWELKTPISWEFVLFRAMFWFAFENKEILRTFCEDNRLETIHDFVVFWLTESNIQDQIPKFIELEERIQAEISHEFRSGSVYKSMKQTFNNTDSNLMNNSTFECQIQWGDASGHFEEENACLAEWESGSLTSITMPDNPSSLNLLRIDPHDNLSMFSVTSLKIKSSEGKTLYTLDSEKTFNDAALAVNLRKLSDHRTFLPLNNDPYFTLDLSMVDDLEEATNLEIKLELANDESIGLALRELTLELDQQYKLLGKKEDQLNEVKSDNAYLKNKVDQIRDARDDLSINLRDITREFRSESRRTDEKLREDTAYMRHVQHLHNLSHQSEETIRHLNNLIAQQNKHIARLTNQISEMHNLVVNQSEHNHAVDTFLMQRPSTRLKGLIARSVRRMMGKPPIPQDQLDSDSTPDEIETTNSKEIVAGVDQVQAEVTSEPLETPDPNVELIGQNLEDFQLWVYQNELTANEIQQAKEIIESLEYKPVFSIIVPIYNTDPDYLLPMIRSVQAQIYPYWELCLVDDCSPKKWLRLLLEDEASKDKRIKVQFNDENKGIAMTSNDALELATGDYIALLDHDDEISIDALYENAKAINERPDAGLIYSDEDKMDLVGNRLEPFFKPDYSPDLLNTNNYVCHFTVIKKTIVDRIGGFRKGFDGSQDHDIILRAIENTSYVHHIPKILYHWRKIPGSTAASYDSKSYAWEAGRKAVEESLQKEDESVQVEFGSLKGTYRVFRGIRGEPLVSIIIPFKDKPKLLRNCVSSILRNARYPNFEIVGVSNNSDEPETKEAMNALVEEDSRVRFVEKNIPFNFSAICNYGVEQSKGDYVLLLNNDVIVENDDWLEQLLQHAQRAEIGAVGGKLLYEDGRIQHAGVVAGMVGAAGHPHKFFPDNHIGYHGRLHMVFNVSAVTGAMLLVKKDKYLEVGGLDEEKFAVAYNDVDFCLKLLDRGYRNLFTPHCRAHHLESASRGYEDTPEKLERLKREQANFLGKWDEFLKKGDPYYNPNLSLLNERFSLKYKEEREAERANTD